MAKREAKITGYIGGKGSGKTYTALRDVKALKHSIRFDPTGQPSIGEGAILLPNLSALKHSAANFDRRKKLHYVWRGVKGMDRREAFLLAVKWQRAVGGVTLFADETDSYIDKTDTKNHDFVRDLLERGRHIGGQKTPKDEPKGCPFVFTGTHYAKISPFLRAQADELNYMRMSNTHFLKFIADQYGKEMADELARAPQYSRICQKIDGAEIIGPDGKVLKKQEF